MIINLTFTIWAVQKFGAPNGLVTLQDGSCKETSTRTTWLHLAINVLSTLLLGASNYAMQCLSFPTRGDVNKAHSRNIWLDIGVPSFRNLRWVSRLRIILWCLLAVSSVPLHFLYNSAIFSTLSVRSFDAAVVSRDYINGAPFSIYVSERCSNCGRFHDRLQGYQNDRSALQSLDNKACIKAYGSSIISAHSDILFASRESDTNNSVLRYLGEVTSSLATLDPCWAEFAPGIDGDCNLTLPLNAQDWSIHGFPIEYCLSRLVKEHCKLQLSVAIMIIG